MSSGEETRCQCGEWSGEACEWSGPVGQTVVVEFMPAQYRASHTAAGNAGAYPYNGASRIRVERACAARMIEYDADWCEIINVRLWTLSKEDAPDPFRELLRGDAR